MQCNWRSQLIRRAIGEVDKLVCAVSHVQLSSNFPDKWSWRLDTHGMFSVNCLRCNVSFKIVHQNAVVYQKWNNWVHIKLNVCVWRAILNRFPSLPNLTNRGFSIPSTLVVCVDLMWKMCLTVDLIAPSRNLFGLKLFAGGI